MSANVMPDTHQARELLASIGWHNVQVKTALDGSVNNTFRVDRDEQTFYLRIGPSEQEVQDGPAWFTGKGLRREQQAIALWSRHTWLFPRTIHKDFSHELVKADWVVQAAMAGDSWEAQRSRLTSQQVASLWAQLGRVMAELHAYTGSEFGPPEPGMGFSRWSELCRWDASGMVVDAHRYDLPLEPFQRLCDLIDRYTHELDEIDQPRLIHSDLGLRHVMVDHDAQGEPTITGIIDLEFARFADAYAETLFVHDALQTQRTSGFEQFLQSYGAPRPDRGSRIRGLIYQLVALAWSATDAMRRDRPREAGDILATMTKRLGEDRHIW